MSQPAEKDKDKEDKEKQEKESADPEPPKVKIEEKKSKDIQNKESKEELEKKIKRAERFGIKEKCGINIITSTNEEMDKRTEIFKEQIELMEEDKKKEKES